MLFKFLTLNSLRSPLILVKPQTIPKDYVIVPDIFISLFTLCKLSWGVEEKNFIRTQQSNTNEI